MSGAWRILWSAVSYVELVCTFCRRARNYANVNAHTHACVCSTCMRVRPQLSTLVEALALGSFAVWGDGLSFELCRRNTAERTAGHCIPLALGPTMEHLAAAERSVDRR